jgi:hypothetical protein
MMKPYALGQFFTGVCSTFTTRHLWCRRAIVLRPLGKYIHEEKLILIGFGTLAPHSHSAITAFPVHHNLITAPSLHIHARAKARNRILSRPPRKRLRTLLKHYALIVSTPSSTPSFHDFNLPIKFCWLIGYPWFCASHLKNTMTSALKVNFHDPSEGMKLNTFMEPLGPTYRSQLKPARFTVVTFWPMG